MKKQIGVVGVDSGTLLIGDPSYWMKDEDYEKEVMAEGWRDSRQIKFDAGHDGKGVLTSTGFGDGCYPVYAEMVDCGEFGERVGRITIDFLVDQEESEPR